MGARRPVLPRGARRHAGHARNVGPYGHAAKESGNVAAAEAAYRKAVDLDPASADAHLQLGHALKIQGRISEAVDAYFQSMALDPAPRHARDELIALGWTPEIIERRQLEGKMQARLK